MIVRLKIKNWRSHHESEFKFSKGVNALLGIMGSGKSSVMDAMCYGLFGTFPNLLQRKLKLNNIIRSKPNQAKEAFVELVFLKDRDVYTVYRGITFDKGTVDVELRKNGELLESGNSEAVTEYIEKILRADYDVFSKAVYAEQNQLDYFLELPKGQRMAQIDNLLKLDRFETARKNITTLINRIGAEHSGKEDAAKNLFTERDSASLENLQKDIENIRQKVSGLENQLKEMEKERESAKKKLEETKELGKLSAKIGQIESEKRGVLSTLEILESELESAKAEELIEEPENLKSCRDELEKLTEEHGTAKQITANLKKLKNQELELSKKIERGKTKIDYLSHAAKDMDAEDKCPLCSTKLKPAHRKKLKDEHKARIGLLEKEIKALNDWLAGAQKEYNNLESVSGAISSLEESVKAAEQELKAAKNAAKEKQERAKQLEAKEKEISKKLSELENAENELREKEKEFGKAELAKLEKEYEDLILRQENLKGQAGSSAVLAKEKEERLEILQKKKRDYETALEEIKWLAETKRSLDVFSSALVKTQESLREEFVKIVNKVMQEVWPTLYPYGDITAVKLEVENRDYVLKARTTTEWVNVEGITSGGERSLAALALRIAFSLALARNLGMLVLDEPTHNLDVNAIDELAITLRERLPNLIEQIFLITHEERLESAVSAYLYKLERNKELDEPTKVNLIESPEI